MSVRSAMYGKIAIEDLAPHTTIGLLKEQLHQRLMLPPTRVVELTSWGRPLDDDMMTLQECRLKNNGQLDMRTSLAQPANYGELERVRLVSTALETRTIIVDKRTTVLELKQKFNDVLRCAEHSWYDSKGVRTAVVGQTLLASTAIKGDPKTETAELRLGEELISTIPHLGEMGKGKPVSVMRARKGGLPFNVVDTNLAVLQILPEKLKLEFQGTEMSEATTLWALGCRTDDTIQVEFESPVMPPILALLRAPDKPKEKKGKGDKGKKKK